MIPRQSLGDRRPKNNQSKTDGEQLAKHLRLPMIAVISVPQY
jgi:hypothetical protein